MEMQPLKGNLPLYTTRDEFTGLKIHAKRLTSESTKQIKEVLLAAKQRIETELEVEVIGIMSDAHPKQRRAIAEVFPGVPIACAIITFINMCLKHLRI